MNERPRGSIPSAKYVGGIKMDVSKFTGSVIAVVVVVIISVSVLIPIIASNQLNTDSEAGTVLPNAESINAMLGIIPLLVIVGILIAVIALFVKKR